MPNSRSKDDADFHADGLSRNDVLIGKGKGYYESGGNTYLRSRIIDSLQHYLEGNNDDRVVIATSLMQEVFLMGGAFKRWDKSKMVWVTLEDEREIVGGIRQRFRNGERDLKKMETQADPAPDEMHLFIAGLFEDDSISGNKQALITRLSGDRGEELAGTLLSILDEVDASPSNLSVDDKVSDLFKSVSIKESFKSLLTNCKPSKRGRYATDDTHEPQQDEMVINVSSNDDDTVIAGTQSVFSHDLQSKTSADKSAISGALSLYQFNKEKYLNKLKIEGPLVFHEGQDGEKKYYGTTLDGLPHGLGFMIYTKKLKYLWGHWRKGKMHGLGGAVNESGHKSFGLFYKNQLEGRAMYVVTNESKYLGEFHKNERHGSGVLNHINNGIYDGTFRNGNFEGTGKRIKNGVVVEQGEFVNWKLVKPSATNA